MSQTYYDKISYFFSKLSADNETYGKYRTDVTHTYYLVEYADTTDVNFSIYDLDTNSLTNYKNGIVL